MLKLIQKKNKKMVKIMERGQVLVVVAMAIVGIVAIIGLTIDVGMMFITDARLRRAVDAAALAAALQYRSGIPTNQLTAAATEFLLVNGVYLNPDPDHPSVIVETCTTPGSTLCDDPSTGTTIPRKLVRVKVTALVHLAFLPVIGINEVPISAVATGESASLDLVLVIDTSDSMTAGYQPGDHDYDPSYPKQLFDPTVCNDDTKASAYYPTSDGIPGECHPFEEVKKAAMDFVTGTSGSPGLFFPFDRVAIVSFNKVATTQLNFDENCPTSSCTPADADAIKAKITGVIKNLQVYDANVFDENGVLVGGICPNGQPCRPYCTQADITGNLCSPDYNPPAQDPGTWISPTTPGAVYKGSMECGSDYQYGDASDPSHDPSLCETTNIADGLWKAGNAFKVDQKPSSLWVVVLLTDGATNAGTLTTGETTCPGATWDPYRVVNGIPAGGVVCRDLDPDTRHCIPGPTLLTCMANGNGLQPPNHVDGVPGAPAYDAEDSARDWADYVGKNLKAVIYTIGIGPSVNLYNNAGEKLLTYAAEFAGNGEYYHAPSATDLGRIFKAIGEKIATRLAQ